jgi:hypothetical protein
MRKTIMDEECSFIQKIVEGTNVVVNGRIKK